MFKHGHVVSLSLVNVMLTTVLSVETTSWANMTTTAFLDDGRNYDHPNFTWPPTPMPTTSSLYSPTQQPIHCDRDNNCTNSPTEHPIIQPSVMPTDAPETGNGDHSSTSISPSISTTGDNEANMSDSESYAWNDPIVLAVGLLGVLVLLLTGMVSIFACMAYTKSKENMRIADKLRVSMMNDNSHSNENDKQEGRRYHSNKNNNHNNNRGQTDYRNVASTDMFLPENEHNNHKNGQQNRGAGPGSVDDDHLLAIDVASGMDSGASPVVVEMNQRSNYNNNNNGEHGGGGGIGNGQDAGFIDDDNDNDDDNNNNDNRQYGSYVTPAGIEHISTDAVIASVQDEGAGSGYNKGGAVAPQLEHVASQTKDSNSHSNDNNNNYNNNDNEQSSNVIAGSISSIHNGGNKESFLQGLNNVAAGNLAAEDDVIAHMATAGGDGGNDENNDNNNVDDDDIQLAFE